MNQYFNRRAETYFNQSQSGIWGIFKKNEIKTVKNLLKIEHGQKILDLGCGPGIYLKKIKEEFNIDETGIDLSPEMIKYAKEILNLNCFVLNAGDFESDSKFDVILCLGVLEFIKDPENIFKKINHLIKKNGQVIILFPKRSLLNSFYKIYHSTLGCETFLHSKQEIIKLAAKYNLILAQEKTLTLCHVLKFTLF